MVWESGEGGDGCELREGAGVPGIGGVGFAGLVRVEEVVCSRIEPCVDVPLRSDLDACLAGRNMLCWGARVLGGMA